MGSEVARRIMSVHGNDTRDLAEVLAAAFDAGLSVNELGTSVSTKFAASAVSNTFTQDQNFTGRIIVVVEEDGATSAGSAISLTQNGTSGVVYVYRDAVSAADACVAVLDNATNNKDGIQVVKAAAGVGVRSTVSASSEYGFHTNGRISVGGNAEVGGTLTVTGTSTFQNNIAVTGTLTTTGNISVLDVNGRNFYGTTAIPFQGKALSASSADYATSAGVGYARWAFSTMPSSLVRYDVNLAGGGSALIWAFPGSLAAPTITSNTLYGA